MMELKCINLDIEVTKMLCVCFSKIIADRLFVETVSNDLKVGPDCQFGSHDQK